MTTKGTVPLSEEDKLFIRNQASNILSSIRSNDQEISSGAYFSWINGKFDCKDSESFASSRCQFFDRVGFLHVQNFSPKEECLAMKKQMKSLVEECWNPNEQSTVFRTDEKQIDEQGSGKSGDYFLDSADRIHFFSESRAMDSDGKLKAEFSSKKMAALNKAGHGLHIVDGPFNDYTNSKKIHDLVTELGWKDPVVPQSMYIFKQARVGGEVTSHQDSTFLYTTPKQSCLGLWLALDDSTIENGCLWVRPFSHKERTRRRFARNPEYFGDSLRSNNAMGDLTKSQMIFLSEKESDDVPWEGQIPKGDASPHENLFKAGFVPVECKAGDLVAFPGTLDHLSLPNYSDHQRHTFQLHLVEGDRAGVTWADTNWLQYPEGKDFISI